MTAENRVRQASRGSTDALAPLRPGGRRYLPPSPSSSREETGDGGAVLPCFDGARVLVIDNYDSFTFNLVQYLLELGAIVDVYRNDAITAEAVLEDGPSHLLLSPGPGRPSDSGVCQELCRAVLDAQRCPQPLPTLGVCLGHQTLCEVHGARVGRAGRIMHGKRSPVIHQGGGLYADLPSPYEATRYHSLIVDEASLPESLVADARTPEGELMGVHHRTRPVFGVQFHPESILTEWGHRLLANFLRSS